MKTVEALFAEIQQRAEDRPANSGTVKLLDGGAHAIGKKIVEEAAEVWMAAEHEDPQRTAEEISQLIYHLEVLMVSQGITLSDIYEYL